MALTPTVSWAQRKHCLFLTIRMPEVTNPEVRLEEDSLKITGQGGSGKNYALNINFFKRVDPKKSRHKVSTNSLEFEVMKEEQEGSFWSRLVSQKEKQHWLRVDFNRWKDEDETESEPEKEEEAEEEVEALEEDMAGLGLATGLPPASSWATGLTLPKQQEWLVDCYR